MNLNPLSTRTSVQAATHGCAMKVGGLLNTSSPNLTLTSESGITLTVPRSLLGRLGAEAQPEEAVFLTFGFTRVTTEAVPEPLMIPGGH